MGSTTNVDLGGDVIRIVPPAVINGDLTYTSKKEIKFDTTDVSILGEIVWKQSEEESEEKKEEPSNPIGTIASHLSSLLAAFLFGIIIIRLFRRYTEESLKQLQKRFSVSLAAGFVGVLIFGACIVVLGVSIIAAIAGKIMISSNLAALGGLLLIISTLLVPITSFSAVSGGIIYYTGSILVALLIGLPLLRLVKPDSNPVGSGTLLTGLVILSLLFAIPYLGVVLYIVATLAGAGAIILGARAARCPENNNQPANHTNTSDTQSDAGN